MHQHPISSSNGRSTKLEQPSQGFAKPRAVLYNPQVEGSGKPVTGTVKKKENDDMRDQIYSRFDSDDLILRDELAIDRTLLANERTLLAYLRSGVALLIAGVSIMHFSSEGWFWMIGVACLPTGIITGVIGILRYRKMNRYISLLRRHSASLGMSLHEPGEPAPPGRAGKATPKGIQGGPR